MKTKAEIKRDARGSVLVIALCLGVIVGLVLGSCLYLVRTQYVSVLRSQHWHTALAAAEAGIEEALAHLNRGLLEPVNPSADGWTLSGGFYLMPNGPRQLVEGRSYHVLFTEAMPPVIYSTGYVTVPVTRDVIWRAIRVDTAPWSPFSFGLVAKSNITLNGNNIILNSYDSNDPNHDEPWNGEPFKTNGDIALRYGLAWLGNANIYGALHISPESTFDMLKNALITGGVINDMNRELPDVSPPFLSAPCPGSKTIEGTNYQYVLGNGNYMVNGNLDGWIYVGAGAKATLYVTGKAKFSVVRLMPGATLRVYVGGPEVVIERYYTINGGGNPYNFQLWGLPTLRSITFNGNDEFVGVIYAPSTELTANGGGRGQIDIYGSVVVKSITSNGHFCLHYDENLARNMPILGYTAVSWREL